MRACEAVRRCAIYKQDAGVGELSRGWAQAAMISMFESMVRRYPDRTCFTYVDKTGSEIAYSYRETRLLAASLARYMHARGVRTGDFVSVDLANCPAYVLLILAAAYGNFTLVVLNHRLTESEKLARVLEVERSAGVSVVFRVDQNNVDRLLERAIAQLSGESSATNNRRPPARAGRSHAVGRVAMTSVEPRTTKALGRATSGRAALKRRNELARQEALESVIHFAEHAAHVFDRGAHAVIMFTSGTTGRSKAVPLTWDNLCRSAETANASLSRHGEGLWQAALPLFHIGGFQVVVRSLLNCCPFILYERFDANTIVLDGHRKGATHISVVDKMLQDMLATGREESLQRYGCILLGGGALNPQTIEQARALKLRVFASYGMTETSSVMAHAQVTASFQGGLRLLSGYQAHIVDPGADGFGRLAVKGPGLFAGYLNARAAYTVDGYFLTGDTAALHGGLLYVKERTDDMFVSGGENVYPAEIREKLLRISGVKDAHVFGTPDATWGRRPVAFVESDQHRQPHTPSSVRLATQNNHAFATSVRSQLTPHLSKIYQPKHICVLNEFPRTGIGKTDRATLERMYDERIEIARVTLYRIRLPFVAPFKTAKGTLTQRESIIVEVTDHAGRTGLGECVSFLTDWYLPETLEDDLRVLREVLAPMVLSEVFLHPREVAPALTVSADAAAHPMACGALEPALWDLYGKIVAKPLWQLVGEEYAARDGLATELDVASGETVNTRRADRATMAVPAGAVVADGSPSETVAAVRRCVDAGYARVKLKVSPGSAVARVRAVKAAVPGAKLTLDANQSFTEHDMDELRELDNCGVGWIEEPLSPRRGAAGTAGMVTGATGSVRTAAGAAGSMGAADSADLFERLARLQRTMKTPICLDESIAHPLDVPRALQYPELRCFALKIGKFGGIQPSVEFVRAAQVRGLTVWMGGMYDTGISKRMHAAFETLPGIDAPGDIGSTSRYFTCDITSPPYTAERGFVTINRDGYYHGLGCSLDRSSLAQVLIDRVVIEC